MKSNKTQYSCIVNQCAAAVVCYETHCNWFAVSCVAFQGSQSLTGENVLEEELSDYNNHPGRDRLVIL